MTHRLKTDAECFIAILQGIKRFEFRKNDRDFKVGDILYLVEWNKEMQAETGDCIYMQVQFIIHGPDYGIPEGYCIMSLKTRWFI